MLGLAPDRRGRLPDADVARLKEFATALHERYARNLARDRVPHHDATDAAFDGDSATFWSAPAGSHHATLEVDFREPVTFDRILLMEWLNDGQHVQQFRVEAWDGHSWKSLVEGRAIGHKRIDSLAPVTTLRVRLNILASSSEAHIREFQLFGTGEKTSPNKARSE